MIMWPLTKFLALAALTSVAAAECAGKAGSCVNVQDETSLLQVNKDVKAGSERAEKEEQPGSDHGMNEYEAYNVNRRKAEVPIEAAAASRRVFDEGVIAERKKARVETRQALNDDVKDYAENIRADKVAVEGAVKRHRAIEREDVATMKEAERQWAKTAAEKKRVLAAAAAGRNAGMAAGAFHAHHADVDAEEAMYARHKAAQRTKALAAQAARAEEKRAAVNRGTEVRAAVDRAYVGKVDRALAHGEQKAANTAEAIENNIPFYEPWDRAHAERVAGGYHHVAAENEGKIRTAKDGAWPHNFPDQPFGNPVGGVAVGA